MPTVDEDNEIARAKRLQRMRETRDAFLLTFGPPGDRTAHGIVMLEALEKLCGKALPKNQLDDHGRTDALQTHRVLGHWDVLQSIHQAIEWKESDHVKAKEP